MEVMQSMNCFCDSFTRKLAIRKVTFGINEGYRVAGDRGFFIRGGNTTRPKNQKGENCGDLLRKPVFQVYLYTRVGNDLSQGMFVTRDLEYTVPLQLLN